MTDVLLTNDDGYESPAFVALVKAVAAEFSVVSVAPRGERSWIGKSITADRQLNLDTRRIDGLDVFVLDGTPSDCAQIGLYNILDELPRMLVSGVNLGLNSGHGRILCSGTVGAAAEAAIAGVKAIASSFYIPPHAADEHGRLAPEHFDVLENMAQITTKVVRIFVDREFDGFDLISLNIPFEAGPSSEFHITAPHRAPYGRLFHGDGRTFRHKVPPIEFPQGEPDTDLGALGDGKVSITPISLGLTRTDCFDALRRTIGNQW